jgi:hypothetical protein
MSIYLDRKYLLLISSGLQNFKQKNNDLWNFKCPFCGDSKTNKLKSRGFIYRMDDNYHYKCHNCHLAIPFGKFLKDMNPSLHVQYSLDVYKNDTLFVDAPLIPFGNKIMSEPKKSLDEYKFIIPIHQLNDEHPAKQYLIKRMIPKERFVELYYSKDFKLFVDEIFPNNGKELRLEEERIIIPFYDENKVLLGFQGRSIDPNNKIRYITIKLDSDNLKLFGLDKLNKNEIVRVVEGPIDSYFLKNCVATCDSKLSNANKYIDKTKLLLIFDNQYYNKDILREIRGSINAGYSVVIFPKYMKEKDLNDMILSGMTINELENLIESRTFSGLRATLELNTVIG